jgi:TorA maturation chaperone TorD
MSSGAPMQFVPTLAPEEAARANFYGLIARAVPGAAGCGPAAQHRVGGRAGGGGGRHHRGVARSGGAASAADPEAVREETTATFIGVGKAPVTLYTALIPFASRTRCRSSSCARDLAELHLARRSEATEPEDHVAALCEVMRHLIAEQKSGLEEQKRFFERWIWPTRNSLCGAIEKSEPIHFYRPVAHFAFAFFELEHAAFEML